MIKEQQNQEKELADLRANTKKISKSVKTENLKEVMESFTKHDSASVTEEEKRGKDEATLRLIEKIRREV